MTTTRPWPDWFTDTYAQIFFKAYLSPLKDMPDLKFLQIGAYTGDASVWLCDNVLTGPGSTLIDVDTWEGSIGETLHLTMNFDEIYDFYLSRISSNVTSFRMTSDKFFKEDRGLFDFIYIDGDHRPRQVLRDAVNADLALKPGGILAFDDYMWSDPAFPKDLPKLAINAFIHCYGEYYDVMSWGSQLPQVWLKKK